jgi:hypothetical protein
MKKENPVPKIYRILLLVSVISFLFLSCTNDASQAKKILGSWTSRVADEDGVVVEGKTMYMEGGKVSFMGTMKRGEQEIPVAMSGTWEVKDGNIQTTIQTSNHPELIPNGFTLVEKIVSVDDKELALKDPDGDTTIYKRVK